MRAPSTLNRRDNLVSSALDVRVHGTSDVALTSFRYVFSIRPLTIRAARTSFWWKSSQLMTGVLISLDALIISLIRGTPWVILIPATPAKWNVFKVICVPGSPID